MSSKEFPIELLDNLSLIYLEVGKSFNLHLDYAELCKRLFNAIGVDSYISPHRHFQDPKEETMIAIKELFALIISDEVGRIKRIS